MNRAIGKLIGLILCLVIIGAGVVGAYLATVALAAPGAHDIVEWLFLSLCAVTVGIGLTALTIWVEVDVHLEEDSWLS